MAKQLSGIAQTVLNAYRDADISDEATIAAVLQTVANELSFGHATGSGIIDEDDLRNLVNEFKNFAK